ncbi:hypothetical protein JHK85_011087 [Glycine max]|uniref:Purple acid phosphatase n=1 Tax=Glycine max TaxID=3847 RepID=A0A0R0KHP8_SOYBN|nr:hypothetical protein JHK85_011087 [Glycine max]KAG5067046.1 hypothetical protein JHK86_010777 [Glycine max]
MKTRKAILKFQLINQRADFSFGLFSGGLSNPRLVAVSNSISFANPKAPVYPRLALGRSWDEMTVTWTSGYDIDEGLLLNGNPPLLLVLYTLPHRPRPNNCDNSRGTSGECLQERSPLDPMDDAEVEDVDVGGVFGGFEDGLGDSLKRMLHVAAFVVSGHFAEFGWDARVALNIYGAFNGKEYIKAQKLSVTAYSIQDDALKTGELDYVNGATVVRYSISGNFLGLPVVTVPRDPSFIHTSFLKELWPNLRYTYKLEHMLSNDQLIKDLDYYDIVFHIEDMPYANGYTSQGDQFTAQVQEISSTVPYIIASGNHERDWPNTGSLFDTPDSGGECGVFAETMYYFPAENRAKFWYKADYGLFRFCVADSEHDWREGSEQYKFIEHCLATIDRKHQPWLIFSAHRPLDYSSNDWYGKEGSFEEPMGRESLQKLWQKYKVEIPFYGHVHNYERMCPIYQNQCVNQEKHQLLWHCERNNSCGCWWWGKSLVRLHTNTPYLESLQGSLDYGFGKLTGIQSFISLV